MSFVVDGDTLKVMADVSVEVVEEQFSERYYWTNPGFAGRTWYEDEFSTIDFETHSIFGGGNGVRHTDIISLGVQKFTKEMSGVIWEGDRTQVDAFEFAETLRLM